jgi:two-component system response regulator AtoC
VNIEAFIQRVGAADVPVLIQGETGAGKEVLARQLHGHSPRSGKPFVKVNCAALPSELVESELFGYERGAFTGAFKGKAGLFEMAEGGTILLDEIGDMDHKLQAKLLQVLQDYQFRRLGGTDPISVDVRVIAATHCELEKLVQENRFREDLYYRLNIVKIHVPPLRERTEEIIPLAEFFVKKYATGGAPALEISPGLRQALLEHHWPGNVRELENVIRRLLVFQDCEVVANELRFRSMKKDAAQPQAASLEQALLPPPDRQPASVLAKVNEARRQAEIQAILAVLNATRWNRKQAAARLNIDYKALLYKMKKLGIEGQADTANGYGG